MRNNKTMTLQQGIDDADWTTVAESLIKPGVKIPVVMYLHGCKGMSKQADQYRSLLLSEDYAVFMPDSFKRPGRRQCGFQGSLQNRVALRTQEVEYALTQIAELGWVDKERLVLMGFSEGGNTTDNWSKPGFAGHLIMGSACTLVGGTPNAPQGTPVLAVVGSRDSYRPGLSCSIDESDGISKSIVLDGKGHGVAQYPQTQNAIRLFLDQCCQANH